MIGQLVIRPQRFEGIPTYGIFVETTSRIDDLHLWQGKDCADIFLGYARTQQGAELAVRELKRYITPPAYTKLQLMNSVRMTTWQFSQRKLPWWRRVVRWVRGIG